MQTVSTWIHPFQAAGLGLAPFRCVGVIKKTYQACHGAPVQAAGMCDYCGTGIMYCYQIKSADSRSFVVGCDCVIRTGQTAPARDSLTREVKALMREARKAKRDITRQAKLEARQAAFAERKATRDRDSITSLYAGVWPWGKHVGQTMATTPRLYLEFWANRENPDNSEVLKVAAKVCQDTLDQLPPLYVSQHVGTVGKRETFALTFQFSTSFPSQFGSFYIQSFTDSAGNVVVYKGGSPICLEVEADSTNTTPGYCVPKALAKGDSVTVKATVKAHDSYKGQAQTIIARPKVQG